MTRQDFFTQNHLGKYIYLWIDQCCFSLSKNKFMSLGNNINFTVDGNGYPYKTIRDGIEVR